MRVRGERARFGKILWDEVASGGRVGGRFRPMGAASMQTDSESDRSNKLMRLRPGIITSTLAIFSLLIAWGQMTVSKATHLAL